LIAELKQLNIILMGTATTVAEAVKNQKVDMNGLLHIQLFD
jgi:hypothetical protein